jgi:phospholipase/carboxylesterase
MKSSDRSWTSHPDSAAARGVLLARPVDPAPAPSARGRLALGLGAERDGLLHVPDGAGASAPLLVFFHGSGASAEQVAPLLPHAERHGVVVLSIDSRGPTWDLLVGKLGPDSAFLDRALRFTFERYPVHPAHVAVSGFSDGASYALSLGLANGELFSHVLAFSPGFAAPPRTAGRPRVFVAHGIDDAVLPIDRCSRSIVQRLKRQGYPVEYREFGGGHFMPAELVSEALVGMLC